MAYQSSFGRKKVPNKALTNTQINQPRTRSAAQPQQNVVNHTTIVNNTIIEDDYYDPLLDPLAMIVEAELVEDAIDIITSDNDGFGGGFDW